MKSFAFCASPLISNVKIDGFKVIDGINGLQVSVNGYDAEHNVKDVTIKGLTIKGDAITSDTKGVTIDKLTTSNVKIEK